MAGDKRIQESRLQTKIIKDLKASGWLVNKIKLCSVNGWPDVFAMKKLENAPLTQCLFLEVKRKGEKPDPLQLHVHRLIAQQGGEVHVIDSWEAYCQLKFLTL